MGKLIRVDMTALKVKAEEAPSDFDTMGGRALSSHIIYSEVPPTCHPLSAQNKLIFAPGLLAGSIAPNSGRISIGAKGVKAIVIDDAGTKPAEAKQKDAFHEVCKAFTKEVVERKFSVIVSKNGTLGGLSWVSKFGSLPTRNFQSGSFEGSNKIGSREVIEQNAERGGSFGHICMPGCVVRCSNVMHDKNGKYVTSGFEYESAAMLGANLGIDDLADQAKSVLKEELAFNRAAGLGPETDRLPDFFTEEPLDQIHDGLPPPEQRVFNVPESETRKVLNF